MPDTLLDGVAKELMAVTAITDLVGAFGVHQIRPYEEVPQGGARLVVRQDGHWSMGAVAKTTQFPVLQIEAWVDPPRSEGLVTSPTAGQTAIELLGLCDDVLHVVDPGNGFITWGTDFMLMSSQRISEPRERPMPKEVDELQVWYQQWAIQTVRHS